MKNWGSGTKFCLATFTGYGLLPNSQMNICHAQSSVCHAPGSNDSTLSEGKTRLFMDRVGKPGGGIKSLRR